MKQLKFWSMMMLMVMALPSLGQEIDERNLPGRWVLQSKTGEFQYQTNSDTWPEIEHTMQAPDVLKFYDEVSLVSHDDSLGVAYFCDSHHPIYEYNPTTGENVFTGEYGEYWFYKGLQDYFISNGDKLHVVFKHHVSRWKIVALDGENMTLETMSGKGTVVYKRDTTSSVQAPLIDLDENNLYYSIDGKQQSILSKGVNIIRMNNGETKKVIVK